MTPATSRPKEAGTSSHQPLQVTLSSFPCHCDCPQMSAILGDVSPSLEMEVSATYKCSRRPWQMVAQSLSLNLGGLPIGCPQTSDGSLSHEASELSPGPPPGSPKKHQVSHLSSGTICPLVLPVLALGLGMLQVTSCLYPLSCDSNPQGSS